MVGGRIKAGLGGIAVLIGLMVGASAPARADGPRVIYTGKLENVDGRPVGGIYPLTFSVYRGPKGGRALWSETHFVAVDNGVYAVELGRQAAFPRGFNPQSAWLGVALKGGAEIVREELSTRADGAVATEAAQEELRPGRVGAPRQAAQGSFADQAGFATEAEHAKRADSIGTVTATELQQLVKQLQTPPTAKVKIGAVKRMSATAGGSGGQPFVLECPPGHVLTGIQGRGAVMIDQIQAICSPLE